MRGLIGFETDLVNQTRGMGVMSHLFHEYGPDRGEIAARKNGSLVSMDDRRSHLLRPQHGPGTRPPHGRTRRRRSTSA
jgi:predicted membrane GTPase involved in stress response